MIASIGAIILFRQQQRDQQSLLRSNSGPSFRSGGMLGEGPGAGRESLMASRSGRGR
jgi:hypothetical protein